MRSSNRIWKEERDGIHLRVKQAIEAELLLCQEEYGIKLEATNIDSLLIVYSKLDKKYIICENCGRKYHPDVYVKCPDCLGTNPTVLSKGLRTLKK